MNEEKNKIIYYSNNTCVSCGSSIPEGQMVCKNCLNKENQEENINAKVITELTRKRDINNYMKMFYKISYIFSIIFDVLLTSTIIMFVLLSPAFVIYCHIAIMEYLFLKISKKLILSFIIIGIMLVFAILVIKIAMVEDYLKFKLMENENHG